MDSSTGAGFKYEIGVKCFQIGVPVIIVLGLVLNPICFVIYSKKSFIKSTTGFYLRILSIADTVAILPAVFDPVSYITGLDVRLLDSHACKLIKYFLYAPQSISAWFEALVSVDRAVSIALPKKFALRKNRKFQWYVCAFVIAYNCIHYFPIFIFFEISSAENNALTKPVSSDYQNQSASSSCPTVNGYYQVLSWMDLFNSTLLPFVAMIASTIIIIRHLARSRNSLGPKALSEGPQHSRTHHHNGHILRRALSFRDKTRTRQTTNMLERREQKDRSFAMTSVAINVLFFVLNIGIVTMNLLSSYVDLDADQYQLFSGVTYSLFYLDFSIKFFTYVIFNQIFRRELTRFFIGWLDRTRLDRLRQLMKKGSKSNSKT